VAEWLKAPAVFGRMAESGLKNEILRIGSMRKPNTVCEYCGKGFYVRPFDQERGLGRCCSRVCWCRLSGKSDPQGYPQKKKCESCGKEFLVSTRARRGKRFCSNSCSRIVSNRGRKGVKHTGHTSLRGKLLNRYLEQCAKPGCGYSTIVVAHHIVHQKDNGNDDCDNGVFLCPNHHGEVHAGLIGDDQLMEWAKTMKPRLRG